MNPRNEKEVHIPSGGYYSKTYDKLEGYYSKDIDKYIKHTFILTILF